jgi:hypothetical protein
MAFDAPRKTLDEIRREIDADYGLPATPDGAAEAEVTEHLVPDVNERPDIGEDEAAFDHFKRLRVKRRRSALRLTRRVGYVIAAVIGCLAGQFALFGYLAVTRHWATSGAGVSAPAPPVTAMPSGASVTVPVPPVAAVPPSPPTLSAPVPDSTATTPSVPVAPPASGAAVSEPPATPFVPPVTMPAPVATGREPVPRRVVRQPPRVPSPPVAAPAPRSEPPTRVVDSEDWVKSQEEVRAALRDWLAKSGFADDSIASGTVVILGADGRTARTHVPTRWGGGVIIREQRWVRVGNDWIITVPDGKVP